MEYTKTLELRRNAQIEIAELLQKNNNNFDYEHKCPVCKQPICDLTIIYKALNGEFLGCKGCVKENEKEDILNEINHVTFEKGQWKSTFI